MSYEMTSQEVFDTVASHLLKQKAKSSVDGDHTDCLYRDPNGNMCAIGCLIPDDKYTKDIEGENMHVLANKIGEVIPIITDASDEESFLQDLQDIHDDRLVESWPDALEKFAQEYNLATHMIS